MFYNTNKESKYMTFCNINTKRVSLQRYYKDIYYL